MNRGTAKIHTTKRAAEMDFMQGSQNQEISRFAIASPVCPHFSRCSKHVQNGYVWFEGQFFVLIDVHVWHININICIFTSMYAAQKLTHA